MPKKEIEFTEISIRIEDEKINIYGTPNEGETISLNLPFRYVNPILNIVSQLTDEDIPAIFEKHHGIIKTEPWSMILNLTIAPETLFKEDD